MAMEQDSAPSGSARPRDLLATLRPQVYAKGAPQKVVDPIVEPLWVGVRTLAAVDDDGALMVDSDGEPIPDVGRILDDDPAAEALAAPSRRVRECEPIVGGIPANQAVDSLSH